VELRLRNAPQTLVILNYQYSTHDHRR